MYETTIFINIINTLFTNSFWVVFAKFLFKFMFLKSQCTFWKTQSFGDSLINRKVFKTNYWVFLKFSLAKPYLNRSICRNDYTVLSHNESSQITAKKSDSREKGEILITFLFFHRINKNTYTPLNRHTSTHRDRTHCSTLLYSNL